VSGGFTNAPGWIQLLADIFGQEMHLQQESDASALGAILLAANVLGWPERPSQQAQTVFTPDATRFDAYRKKYKMFLKLYGQIEECLTAE